MRVRPTRRTLLTGALGVASGAALLRAKVAAGERHEAKRLGLAFGTTVSLTAIHADASALGPALDEAFQAIRHVERVMSLYDPRSELSALNRDGLVERPDPALVAVLRLAKDIAEATDGAFDPTIQPLWALWAEATRRGAPPRAEELARSQALVDHRGLSVCDGRIRLARPGMAVTLNGIAQGYAADTVMAVLRRHGVEAALVDTGEFGARGRPAPDRPFVLALHHAELSAAAAPVVALEDGFISTSGDDETVFFPDIGAHHILDPRTGRSPARVALVSVRAATGALADALSTAAFVLGPERGTALVRSLAGAPPIVFTHGPTGLERQP